MEGKTEEERDKMLADLDGSTAAAEKAALEAFAKHRAAHG